MAFFVNEPKACFKVKWNKKSQLPQRGMALIIMKRPPSGITRFWARNPPLSAMK